MTLSSGAAGLKRGYTFDPEDSRHTRRLQAAHETLREMGVRSRVEHDAPGPRNEGCRLHPDYAGTGMLRNPGYCSDRCRTVWPEWVTDEMFELAWRAADATATLRGQVNNAKAAAERRRAAAANEVK